MTAQAETTNAAAHSDRGHLCVLTDLFPTPAPPAGNTGEGVVFVAGSASGEFCAGCCDCQVENFLELTLYPYASSFARWAAFTTALIRVTRNLPSSSSIIASMVHPAGVVTASLRRAG